MAGQNLHRIVFILTALVANYLLYLAFYSTLKMTPEHAAELAAGCAFVFTAGASFFFRKVLEG